MRISENPPLHLTYCLNVHPGESWEEIFDAIGAHARRVRDNVGREQAYGLGLRLGNAAARSLAEPGALETFRAYLRDENLYVFTINGFPYGRFHGRAVKENVYRPDWRTDDRRRYTIQLAELLAGLLPEDCPGTISTVPCSFKPWIVSDQDRLDMIRNLVACVRHLRWLSIEHGKEISLGLEPEPCCYLETTAGFLEFYEEELLRHGAPLLATALQIGRGEAEEAIRRHLGLCLDTCHLALQFEDLCGSMARVLDAGIQVTKVQISAALEVSNSEPRREALRPFVEPVYLHQVKLEKADGSLESWEDLPAALEDLRGQDDSRRIRVHFHVPLFWAGSGKLGTTAGNLTPEFFALLEEGQCPHLEIETYTFNVLPPELKEQDVVASIVKEHEWVLKHLSRRVI